MQISLALVTLAFVVAKYFGGYITVYGSWGALEFYLVAGILGVVSGQTNGRNKCAIVGCLVMSILSAVSACINIITSIGSFFATDCYLCDYYYELTDASGGWYVVNILMILVAVVELVTAIVSTRHMCSGINDTPDVVGQQQYVVQPGQVVNQGQAVIQRYPMMQQQVVGQPQFMGQPQWKGQPQFTGQAQHNVQYMGQTSRQLTACTEI